MTTTNRSFTATLTSLLMLALISLGFATGAYGEDEAEVDGGGEGDPAVLERPIYLPLKPAFVVNYGGVGKLKYMKVEMSVRVKDTESANAVRHHMPLIRHHLVMLLSKQKDEDIDTQAGKQAVREAGLAGIQEIIETEQGEHGVIDLFFNNFVIQR